MMIPARMSRLAPQNRAHRFTVFGTAGLKQCIRVWTTARHVVVRAVRPGRTALKTDSSPSI